MRISIPTACAAALAALSVAAPAAQAQSSSPPTLAGTDLSAFDSPDGPGTLDVLALRCSAASGFGAYSATGTAANGQYDGPFNEDGAAQLGAGDAADPFANRSVRAAGTVFSIRSPRGRVRGTQRATGQADGGSCGTQNEFLLFFAFPNTRYGARIETSRGVFVDRGTGSLSFNLFRSAEGSSEGSNTLNRFEFADRPTTRLLRRADCDAGGFAELAYPSEDECRRAAARNPPR